MSVLESKQSWVVNLVENRTQHENISGSTTQLTLQQELFNQMLTTIICAATEWRQLCWASSLKWGKPPDPSHDAENRCSQAEEHRIWLAGHLCRRWWGGSRDKRAITGSQIWHQLECAYTANCLRFRFESFTCLWRWRVLRFWHIIRRSFACCLLKQSTNRKLWLKSIYIHKHSVNLIP